MVEGGRVHRVHDRVFVVEGDHGRYLVAVADGGEVERVSRVEPGPAAPSSVCSCPARGECSHVVAAQIVELRGARAARVTGVPAAVPASRYAQAVAALEWP